MTSWEGKVFEKIITMGEEELCNRSLHKSTKRYNRQCYTYRCCVIHWRCSVGRIKVIYFFSLLFSFCSFRYGCFILLFYSFFILHFENFYRMMFGVNKCVCNRKNATRVHFFSLIIYGLGQGQGEYYSLYTRIQMYCLRFQSI